MKHAKQMRATQQPSGKIASNAGSSEREQAFVDNREAAVAQRRLADVIAHSPRSAALRGLVGAIGTSPRAVAQRARIDVARGGPVQRQECNLATAPETAVEEIRPDAPIQPKAEPAPNRTGMPDGLKAGIESLSGMDMSDVRVHTNSDKPAQLNALAYAQGNDIHLGPQQEQHLPHEAWHVVQQAQGRVRPTAQMKGGVPLNDDSGLEHEADIMGARALQVGLAQTGAVQRKAMAPGSSASTSRDTAAGVVQARQHFNANHQSMALPGPAANARDYVVQTVIVQTIAALDDDATLNDAIAAINLAAQHDHLMTYELLGLRWNGAEVYLVDTVHNVDADLLGSVMDDQNPGLYLAVNTGTASHLQVNKDTGEERVLDAAGRYIPRTIARSITLTERNALSRRDAMRPRVPNAGLTPLEHVAGGQNSQYTSYSRAPGDVVNSHGRVFNAQGTGRVNIDLLHIAPASILDLSTHEGINAHLRPQLPQNARAQFDAVSTAAKTKAEDEVANGITAPAGTTNPHRQLLTDQRWQALVDAYRTQEVLVEGDVPFDAVTSFSAFTGAHNPLTALAQQGIGAHAQTAAQHSQTGTTELAAHRSPAAPVLPGAWQAVVMEHTQVLEARKNEFLFKNKVQGVPNAKQRNTAFRQAMERVYAGVVAEVNQVATAYYLRSQGNWNNATLGDMTTELANRRVGWVADLEVVT